MTSEPMNQKKFRCLYRRCPPLPIPNREVKPARADGTAVKCGRVGRCQILQKGRYRRMTAFFVEYRIMNAEHRSDQNFIIRYSTFGVRYLRFAKSYPTTYPIIASLFGFEHDAQN